MIYGKKNNITTDLKIAIGVKDGKVIGGPVDSIKAQTKDYIILIEGNKKASDIARRIKRKIGGEIDDIIRMLPSGGCELA
jgi:hypothetical protein